MCIVLSYWNPARRSRSNVFQQATASSDWGQGTSAIVIHNTYVIHVRISETPTVNEY